MSDLNKELVLYKKLINKIRSYHGFQIKQYLIEEFDNFDKELSSLQDYSDSMREDMPEEYIEKISSLIKEAPDFIHENLDVDPDPGITSFLKRYVEQCNEDESYKQIGYTKINLILNYLFSSNDERIDEESMRYRPDDYPFTKKEFMGLYNYLSDLCESEDKNYIFPESRRYFEYNGKRFIWRMLVGQGTCCQLLLEDNSWPKDWPMIINEERLVII